MKNFKLYLFYVYEYTIAVFRHTRKGHSSYPITDGCEPPCRCWELNSGPLEEQLVLLTADTSLQAPDLILSRASTASVIAALGELRQKDHRC
jgi:E3 ubiquitin-protein ligase NEDD4